MMAVHFPCELGMSKRNIPTPTRAKMLFATMACALLLRPVTAMADVPRKPNPQALPWILQKASEGQIPDLITRFPKENDRVMSATDLKELFVRGVPVKHAVVVEPLILRGVELQTAIVCESCRFESAVDFTGVTVRRGMDFNGSSFRAVRFRSLEAPLVTMNDAVFASSVDFAFAAVGGLEAMGSRFENSGEAATFNSTRVRGIAAFSKATFSGSVDFVGMTVDAVLMLDRAQFLSTEKSVFLTLITARDISLGEAVFSGPVDFRRTEISGVLEALEANFKNPDARVTFNGTKVGGGASFSKARFAGPADFRGMVVGSELQFDGATFAGPVQFNSSRVESAATFSGAVFSGGVDFAEMVVGSELQIRGSKFTNKKKGVSLNSLKAKYVFLDNSVFAGSLDFRHAEIASSLEAPGVRYENADVTVTFNSTKVGAIATFSKARFAGPADFRGMVVASELQFDGATFAGPVQFNNSKVESAATFSGAVFSGAAEFNSIRTRIVHLDNAVFAGSLDFAHAEIVANLEAPGVRYENADVTVTFNSTKVGAIASFSKACFAGPRLQGNGCGQQASV